MKVSVINIGLAELIHRWRETVLMAGIIAISILGVLLLGAYQRGLEDRYAHTSDSYLVVQQSGSIGEMQGSQLPAGTSRARTYYHGAIPHRSAGDPASSDGGSAEGFRPKQSGSGHRCRNADFCPGFAG